MQILHYEQALIKLLAPTPSVVACLAAAAALIPHRLPVSGTLAPIVAAAPTMHPLLLPCTSTLCRCLGRLLRHSRPFADMWRVVAALAHRLHILVPLVASVIAVVHLCRTSACILQVHDAELGGVRVELVPMQA